MPALVFIAMRPHLIVRHLRCFRIAIAGVLVALAVFGASAVPSNVEAGDLTKVQSAEAHYKQGIQLRQQKNLKEAEKLLREAVEEDPSFGEAWLNLAQVIAAQERLSEALGPARRAAQLMPDNPEALRALGRICSRNHLDTEGIENLRRVVQIQNSSAQAHLDLGIALADAGNGNSALPEFRRATELDPTNILAHYSLGRAYFETGRLAEAHRELLKVIARDGNQSQALYFLALTEESLHGPAAAVPILERLLLIQPDNSQAHFRLGRNLFDLGDTRRAEAEWRTALQLNPDDEQAAYRLMRALRERDPKEAENYARRLSAVRSTHDSNERAQDLGSAAVWAASRKNWEQAITESKEALRICGNCSAEAQLRKNLGLIYAQSGDVADAAIELEKAKVLRPEDPEILEALHLLAKSR